MNKEVYMFSDIGYVVVHREFGNFGEIIEQYDCSEVFDCYELAYEAYCELEGPWNNDLEIEERYFGDINECI